MENRILLNQAACTHCNKIIQSYGVHMYTNCTCGKIAVDGGYCYLKRTFEKQDDYIDLSIMDDGNHELRRQAIHWAVNFTKDMQRLPETKWTPIEDLNYEHIEAILSTQHLNDFYKEVFETELYYRDLCDELHKDRLEGVI